MTSPRYRRVAAAVFSDMFKWSLWFFSILFVIHLVRVFWLNGDTNQIEGFFVFSQYSVNIFMLVVGIMSAYVFMSRHIQQGVSRKDSYLGTALAALALSAFATLVPLAVNGLQHLLAETISLPVELDTVSAFETTGGWFAAAIALFLNTLTFFLAGWVISIGYYRFGWIAGFGFIALSFVIFGLNDYLWKPNTADAMEWLPYNPLEANFWLTALGSSVLILLLFSLMRLLTKRVTIKM
ncbi:MULTISPECIES: hypothetical protein [Planococcus]|uniref:Uncharacterized protein n=1 Tax=Planococcus maitriensis TaxID=221799 RepID=A0A365K3I1_9BACL|nr:MULTISPECIES: hypothetical protein [Planococcus]AUD13199.1 hypothetical protein CW734_05220 [Planococcus sp. MB-3u-03]PKG45313.1 hypothetical protein CXF66_11845 [Planococcus sp. Urea-trap-24]PKG89091.1 hypothetical protein CXF91_09690 [Planococcus sp. Urea-3u-39]PKH39306.1 hypothetical protein CXF77_09925 [Planococcus sp. MB-3u-09]RAZ67174.1 hypothetical protein DP119_10395 [Planococcus maitriensis]